MRFPTKYDEHLRVHCENGERMRIEYQLVIGENGTEELKPTGMHDLYEEIQSHADSVDLGLIMARYAAGDSDALEKVQGFYGDISGMPMKLQDVMNINIRGKELFDSLPQKYKDLFGNNYIKFIDEPEILAAKLREVENSSIKQYAENIEKIKEEINGSKDE